jgi:hypothetical protein
VKTRIQASRFIMTMMRSLGMNIPSYLRRAFCRVKVSELTPELRRTRVPWVTSSLMSRMPLSWVSM